MKGSGIIVWAAVGVGSVLSAVAMSVTAGCATPRCDAACDTARHDRAVFGDPTAARNRSGGQADAAKEVRPRERGAFRPDLTGLDRPNSLDGFHQVWCQPCVSQEATGECWAYSATSFMESEAYRVNGRKVRLSPSWTVYWEYVEKARRFVRHHGDSFFANGSEPNAVQRIWPRYGIVPADAYTGLPPGKKHHSDGRMYSEMRAHLNALKEKGEWDEEKALAAIRAILDKHMGPPPQTVEVDGKSMTPREYLQRVVGLDPGKYMSLLSLMQEPWDRWCLYDVPDNWWRSRAYYNVPLNDFARVIREAVRGGMGISLLEDNSEPGFYGRQDVAIVPSFDIPSAFIDDAARQFRFSNGTTGDDHAVHLVGYQERNGRDWYLVKDSGGGPRRGHFGGYMFYDEDYVKLKVLAVFLPREAVEHALGRTLGPMPRGEEEQAATAPSES